MNPNGIAHPSIMHGLLRNWDGKSVFPEKPLFYQALDDYTADTMEGVSNEILDVKEAILKLYPSCDLSLVRSIERFFLDSYQDDIADKSSLKMMFVSNKGYDGLTMPTEQVEGGYLPLFDHRYFTEDLPCGILIQKGVAELAGVPTPIMDKVIMWCQEKVGNKEYLVDGKLTGKDIAFTKTPQRYGYTDLKTFMEENGYA
jgi:NAD/NADP octopine/nopaline dehydrogenase, alpha-helical domain